MTKQGTQRFADGESGIPMDASDQKNHDLKHLAYKQIFHNYKGMDGDNEWDDATHVKKHIRKLNLTLKINDTIGKSFDILVFRDSRVCVIFLSQIQLRWLVVVVWELHYTNQRFTTNPKSSHSCGGQKYLTNKIHSYSRFVF